MLALYRFCSILILPALWLWLRKRMKEGKEDKARLMERFGRSVYDRPEGKLLWIHAASVGESQSILPIMHRMLSNFPELHVLITTGTVTSAKMLEGKLPDRALHQYVPIDSLPCVWHFLNHWQPDAAIFVESELWPNLIMSTAQRGCPLVLVNARMSEKSFLRWLRWRPQVQQLLAHARLILAQGQDDARRFHQLGAPDVRYIGNIKFDAAPLAARTEDISALQSMLGKRPFWVAASTHPGEEAMMANVHRSLERDHPDMITIIVPRHAHRGGNIAAELRAAGFNVAQRSKSERITESTHIYLADTMGELGVLYRLAPIVFVGGSLVPHGGQNPLEPARLRCAVVCGPYMHNFNEILEALKQGLACIQVQDTTMLAETVASLFHDPHTRREMEEAAANVVAANQGVLERTVLLLEPFFRKSLTIKAP